MTRTAANMHTSAIMAALTPQSLAIECSGFPQDAW